MDKFFISGVQSDSSDEEEEDKIENEDKVKRQRMKNMAEGLESDDDDAHKKMTQKEKRIRNLKEVCKAVSAGIKKVDFVAMHDKTELLLKELGKARLILEREGGVPEFVLRTMLAVKKTMD
jgi:hypothetical protein